MSIMLTFSNHITKLGGIAPEATTRSHFANLS